jgi:hypothetical protein
MTWKFGDVLTSTLSYSSNIRVMVINVADGDEQFVRIFDAIVLSDDSVALGSMLVAPFPVGAVKRFSNIGWEWNDGS